MVPISLGENQWVSNLMGEATCSRSHNEVVSWSQVLFESSSLFPKVTQSIQTPLTLLGKPGTRIKILHCCNFQTMSGVLETTSLNVCSLNWTRRAQKHSQAWSQLKLLVHLDPVSCLDTAETHLCQITSTKPVLPTGAD